MRNCRCLKTILLVFLFCGLLSPIFAAHETSQGTQTRIMEPEQVNPGDRVTVYENSGRVLELIVDEVISARQASQDTGLTGTYLSEITSSDGWYFRHKKHRELVITLEQKGNSITGSDSLTNSEISGTLEGNTINFEFWSGQLNNNNTVVGKWEVNADRTRFEGSWNLGKWNLTRLGLVVTTRQTVTPMIRGKLVSDQSTVEVLLAEIDKIEVQHDAFVYEDSIATVESATPPSEPSPSKPSRSSNSEFGMHYANCLGKVAVYGVLPIIAAGSDGIKIGFYTSVLGTVFCLPMAGAIVTTEPITKPSMDTSVKGSVEGSSRNNYAEYRNTDQLRFLALTRENLARDMARGGGEYLTTMAYLEGCPVEVHDSFAQMTRRNFRQIIPQAEMDAEVMLQNLEAQIVKDPLLASSCSGVS
jgi:hypothetical protein